MFKITFHYHDDKVCDFEVKFSKASEFFAELSKKNVYFDFESNVGFWTDLNSVRYITLKRDPNGEQSSTIPVTDGVVCPCDVPVVEPEVL
jgi:hypothetical protein